VVQHRIAQVTVRDRVQHRNWDLDCAELPHV
jgi:hypothetical protein